jgi:hypothetical protein
LAEGVRASVTAQSNDLASAGQSVLAQLKSSCKTLSEGFSMIVQVGCAICTALEVPGMISADVTEILELVLNCFTGMFMYAIDLFSNSYSCCSKLSESILKTLENIEKFPGSQNASEVYRAALSLVKDSFNEGMKGFAQTNYGKEKKEVDWEAPKYVFFGHCLRFKERITTTSTFKNIIDAF